jgi:hypothetical protein
MEGVSGKRDRQLETWSPWTTGEGNEMMIERVLMNVPVLWTDHSRMKWAVVRLGVDVLACLGPDHTCTYLKWSGVWVVDSWV